MEQLRFTDNMPNDCHNIELKKSPLLQEDWYIKYLPQECLNGLPRKFVKQQPYESISFPITERKTEDNHTVYANDYVWEIMWKWHNRETSTPYPEQRRVAYIPPTSKIWMSKENCLRACKKLLENKYS